ncbi:unnamed protein product [Aphanomyces euteiches]|uniref:J domain-containing protein n=1 Tax=Aphanomyces euteiches TaxID=100861 RepID=A0A6G0WNB0_9STRA|nr:hypothetical protein Ae201684_013409 [Aphanomyces euteiches]KAH9063139.1 hypothetical protein Ae201684P_009402 [Aphanomyces euteiches]KAH9143557.1 hypothetical protein AeRB84_012439 [Aphanomyces euteiches]
MEGPPPIWFTEAPEVDYYAALNVHRDATAEEIRRAFMALSREFHPDKTKHAEEANQQYPRLDRAYKVLSSRPLRIAYDQYGERGVAALEGDKSADWTLASYAHQDEYVQDRLRVLLRRWHEQQVEAQFPSHTECEVEVDASDFVQHPLYSIQRIFNKQHRMLSVSQMVMRQSTTLHVSRDTTVVIGGYLYDKHGLGVGALTCGINYITADPSALRIHLNSEIGWTPKLSVHLEQPVSTVTTCFLMPELTVDGLDVTVGVHHAMKLLPHVPLQGSMMLSSMNGLSSSLLFQHQSWVTRTSIAIRDHGPQLGLSVQKQLTDDSSAKVAVDLGVSGAAVTLGTSGKVSRRSRLSMGLRFALRGISVRFGFARGNVRFVVPVVVAPLSASNAWNTFFAATTPFLVAALVRQVVKPARKRKKQEALESAHAKRVSYLIEARRCALSQQKLMEKQANKTAGDKPQAVSILVARYGQHPSTAPLDPTAISSIDDINIDVTIPLRFFLQDGKLQLPAGTSKGGLLGFYNPCVSLYDPLDANHPAQPRLYIRYAYDGQVYEATFGDLQAVVLPSIHAQPMGAVGQII